MTGILTVPENWNLPNKSKIKLAVAKLHSLKETNKSVIYVSGGPGGWSIGAIKKWLNHPLRNEANLILIDLRGTGFSEPKLCPDLGKSLFQVFSKNHNVQEDIEAMVSLSIQCKRNIIEKGINPRRYNSYSISKDLHALKNVLKIDKWFVYGLSYGTYISQVYIDNYPDDIEAVILDSPIAESKKYYNENTSNSINSLNLLFKQSKLYYNNIESHYYEVIKDLEKSPITVSIDSSIISSGKFT